MDPDDRRKLKQAGLLESGVYMIHQPETGEYYIGSSENMDRRYRDHFRELNTGTHKNKNLQRAFNEDPNFQFVPVPLPDHLLALVVEDRLIKRHWGDPKFLNLAKDVKVFRLSAEVSEETRQRMSDSQKALYDSGYTNPMLGRTHSPEVRETIRQNALRQFEDPVQRKLLSQRATENFNDPIFRQKHSAAVREAMADEEVSKRTSEAATRRWENPETREKLVEAAKARAATVEGKANSSAAGKKAWENPELRAMHCKSVSIDGVTYESMSEAARVLGIGLATISYRLNSGSDRFKDWTVV